MQGLAPPTVEAVSAEWLCRALELAPGLVRAATVTKFTGGFSPVQKALVRVEYDAAATAAAGQLQGALPPQDMFVKLLPAEEELAKLSHALGAKLAAAVQQAQRVEAAFYALAMRHAAATGAAGPLPVPRAFHASPTVLLLENPCANKARL